MANQEDTAAPEQPKSRKLAWLLVVAVTLLLGGGGSAAAYFTGMLPWPKPDRAPDENAHANAEPPATGHDPAPVSAIAVAFVDMPDLIVNLQADARRMRFLKLRLALEVEGGATADAVRALMPRIMDGFQAYLRALTAEELSGAAGVQRLKEGLVTRANLAIEPLKVADVLLKEMLVQ